MNDAVHILLAIALTYLLLRTEKIQEYLVSVLGVSFPMIDHFLITPLITLGFLGGPIWLHRSITHSLLAGALVVAAGYVIGYWKPAMIGYSSHLVPDFFCGGVKLFLPFNTNVYGFNISSFFTSAIVGFASGLILVYALIKYRKTRRHRRLLLPQVSPFSDFLHTTPTRGGSPEFVGDLCCFPQ